MLGGVDLHDKFTQVVELAILLAPSCHLLHNVCGLVNT